MLRHLNDESTGVGNWWASVLCAVCGVWCACVVCWELKAWWAQVLTRLYNAQCELGVESGSAPVDV